MCLKFSFGLARALGIVVVVLLIVCKGCVVQYILSYTTTRCVNQVLRDLGVDLDVQDNNGMTAAMLASFKGHVESVKLLHEMKADLTLRVKDGSTAVHIAAHGGHTEVLKVNRGNKA